MIHPKAIINDAAILAPGVKIGPYAIVEKGVRIGKNTSIGPFAHLKGDTEIGENNIIGTGAIIGENPQILGVSTDQPWQGKTHIGNNNIIREYVTIHSSSSADKVTSLKNNNYLMGLAHIAHDCQIENEVIICNGSLLAGHITVEDKAFISGNVVVHQFVRIGSLAMIGGLSRVNQDVPPFMMVVGDSRVWGLNLVGLKRAGFKSSTIKNIKDSFNTLYRKGLSLKNALAQIKKIDLPEVKKISDFVSNSNRGICGAKRSTLLERIFLDYPYLIRTNLQTNDKYQMTIEYLNSKSK